MGRVAIDRDILDDVGLDWSLARHPVGNQCFTGDLNGDGMTDTWCESSASGPWSVMMSTGTGWTTSVWNGPVVQLPVYNNCITGDFNGDGRSDTICETASGNGNWASYLSTGAGWAAVTWNGGPAPGFPIQNQCMSGDINGDGYADLYCETGPATGQWDVGLADGSKWTHLRFSGPSPGTPVSKQCFDGDLNGDGQIDFWCSTASGSASWATAISNSILPGVVTDITNGLGSVIHIDYTRLTDATTYTKLIGSTYPNVDIQDSRVVVKNEKVSDGVGGMHSVTYLYQGAREEQRGRGSLGFQVMTARDLTKNTRQDTYYNQSFPYIGSPTYTKISIDTGVLAGHLISEEVDSLAPPVNISNGGPTRYYPYVQQKIAREYEINGNNPVSTSTVSNLYYDEPSSAFYGNLTRSSEVTFDGSESGGGTQFQTSTINVYNNDSTNWLIGRLSASAVQRSAANGNVIARHSSFSYDPVTGLITEEVIEPTNSQLEVITDYGYDRLGHVVSKKQSGSTFISRTTTSSYDTGSPNYGMFLTQGCNALSQCTSSTYDPRTGNVASGTDLNGQVATFSFDGFGRDIGSVYKGQSINKTTSKSRFWCSSNPSLCSVPGTYGIQATSNDGSVSVGVYDVLEREIRNAALSGNGTWLESLSAYDSLGHLAGKSSPRFAGSSYTYWTTMSYDLADRETQINAPIDQNHPSGRIQTMTYNGLTTVVQDPRGNQSTTRLNALGKTLWTQDAYGKQMSFAYDAYENLVSTTDPLNNSVVVTYDSTGRFRVAQSDPDMGAWLYAYNALGELISQTTAKNQTMTMTYDVIGRPILRQELEGNTVWTYDTLWKGALTQVTSPGYERDYAYTTFGTVAYKKTIINGDSYALYYSYDVLGRLTSTIYPTLTMITNGYNSYGYLDKVSDSAGTVYWQATAWDEWGKTYVAQLGNGVETSYVRDPASGHVDHISAQSGSTILQSLDYTWDLDQNMMTRTDLQQNSLSETASYDALNRLTQTVVSSGGTTGTAVVYDSLGNITTKAGSGYVYTGSPHAVTKVGTTAYTYDQNGNLLSAGTRSYTWSSYNYPLTLTSGLSTSTFTYGPDRQKILQQTTLGLSTEYIDGSFEVQPTLTGTGNRIYIGTPDGPVALITAGSTGTILTTQYWLKDHLGSTSTILNGSGTAVQQLSYDAFGQRRASNWSSEGGPLLGALTNYGYTGQDELDNVGLIHMNGRVYDPVLGRFLSPDPIIQSPTDLQSYNRYSYVANNPLTETDPSGFIHWGSFAKIFHGIGAVDPSLSEARILAKHSHVTRQIFETAGDIASIYCGPYVGLCVAANTAFFENAGGAHGYALARSSAIAGATAEASYGVGQGAQAIGGFDGYVTNVVGQGVVNGTSTALRGGNFASGFASGSFSSALSPGYSTYTPIAIVEAAAVGGTASVIGGGKFANGAETGAFSYLVSHAPEIARDINKVYLTGHSVMFFLPTHLAVEYTSEDGEVHTISGAPDSDGKLFGQPDRSTDHSFPILGGNITVSEITPPDGMSASQYFESVKDAYKSYNDNKFSYGAIPSVWDFFGSGSYYNSNGFAEGIVSATHGSANVNFNHYVGGYKQVPNNSFGPH